MDTEKSPKNLLSGNDFQSINPVSFESKKNRQGEFPQLRASAARGSAGARGNNYTSGKDSSRMSQSSTHNRSGLKPGMEVADNSSRGREFAMLLKIDNEDDPHGERALQMVDFTSSGLYCPRKEFSDPKDAQRVLDESKTRISELLNNARHTQLHQFKNAMGAVVTTDQMIENMPKVRVTAAKNFQGAMSQERYNIGGGIYPQTARNRNQVRRQFSSLQKNYNTSSKIPHSPSNAFEPVNAHHRFSKDSIDLRNMFKQLCSPKGNTARGQDVPSIAGGSYNMMSNAYKIGINDSSDNDDLSQINNLQGSMAHRPKLLAKDGLTLNLLQNTPQQVHSHRIKQFKGNTTTNSMFLTAGTQVTQQSVFSSFSGGPSGSIGSGIRSGVKNSSLITHQDQLTGTSQYLRSSIGEQDEATAEVDKITKARMVQRRPQPRVTYIETATEEEEHEDTFTANPAEDIPRNKLTEKLAHGIQSYVQRMQRREGFRIDVTEVKQAKWIPAPRECATLTTCGDYRMFMIGGLNFDAVKEISQARIMGESVIFQKVPYSSHENIQGRQCHSACAYNNKIYIFGGCFMFNRKRQVRECTNQLVEFDIYEHKMSVIKTKGYSAGARKNHTAAVFQQSLVVYGGQSENGLFQNEMLVCQLDTFEWTKLTLKAGIVPFIQGGSCSVQPTKKQNQSSSKKLSVAETVRKSDTVFEGIYFFGGRKENGELNNKLRYFKPVTVDNKVIHGEFPVLKTSGAGPVGRYGHTMAYLPVNNAILIAGGRNDEMCKTHFTPLLNDLFLFLLDQKIWLNVKYSVKSEKLAHIGNHCMSVVSDGETYEKILIFGGIESNSENATDVSQVQSHLSNKTYIVNVQQRSAGKSFFKDPSTDFDKFGSQNDLPLSSAKRLNSKIFK